jgi:hypothetical protein
MGVSISWLAMKGASREAALSALGLRGTEVFEELPESPLTGVLLPKGWYMVVSNHGEYPAFMEDKTLARVSATTDVITCFIEEHVMCSHAAEWRGGRELWSLMHMADTGGIEHLEIRGEPPSSFASIRDRLRAKQQEAGGKKAEVDYIFDIPVETAQHFTGYLHDRDIPGASHKPFEVLDTTDATPKRSWLRRVLGV